jgi:hypothetical protein
VGIGESLLGGGGQGAVLWGRGSWLWGARCCEGGGLWPLLWVWSGEAIAVGSEEQKKSHLFFLVVLGVGWW